MKGLSQANGLPSTLLWETLGVAVSRPGAHGWPAAGQGGGCERPAAQVAGLGPC